MKRTIAFIMSVLMVVCVFAGVTGSAFAADSYTNKGLTVGEAFSGTIYNGAEGSSIVIKGVTGTVPEWVQYEENNTGKIVISGTPAEAGTYSWAFNIEETVGEDVTNKTVEVELIVTAVVVITPDTPTVKVVKVLASPKNVEVKAGGKATFVAEAENYTEIEWRVVKPDGNGCWRNKEEVEKYFAGVSVNAYKGDDGKEYFELSNVPTTISGFYIQAKFLGQDESGKWINVLTEAHSALLTVKTGNGTLNITKSPLSEKTDPNGTIYFTASADNYTKIEWRIVKPDGTLCWRDKAEIEGGFPGVKATAYKHTDGKEYLKLANVPATMNGYYVQAKFWGKDDAGNAVTKLTDDRSAMITVKSGDGALKITKSPLGETVNKGGKAVFIAGAENYTKIEWRIVDTVSDSCWRDKDEIENHFSGVRVTTEKGKDGREYITLENIPVSMNGHVIQAKFWGVDKDGQSTYLLTDGSKAGIKVNGAPSGTSGNTSGGNSGSASSGTTTPVVTPPPNVTPTPAVPEKKEFKMTFKDGAQTIYSYTLKEGEKASYKGPSTVREGYNFAGWYKDAELQQEFDLASEIITEDTIVYGKWIPIYTVQNMSGDWEKNGKTEGGMQLKASAKGSDLVSVMVDGVELNADRYVSEPDTNIVILKADYLNDITVGTHKVKLNYGNGETNELTFTVTENTSEQQYTEEEAKTGWGKIAFVAFALAAAGSAAVLFVQRKPHKH